MKKIVCIHLLNDYSGSPFVFKQAIDVFSNNSWDVDLYTNDTIGFLSEVEANKFSIIYKRFNNKVLTLFSYIFSQIFLFFKLLKYRNQDAVFYVNTMMPFGAAIAGKLMKKEVVYHIHETSISPKLLKKFLTGVIKLTATKNIFVSKDLYLRSSINKIESSIVYNSLPEKFLIKANKNRYKLDGVFNVLLICSLKKYKGVYEFIDIALNTIENKNISYTLVLNANEKEVDSFFKEIDIPSTIKIFPSQKNISTFYTDASLVLNLSRVDGWVETFGMTILEAMSFGVPVIVPPIGGPLELVTDGVEGYCISSYETGVIATKIIEISKDENLRVKLSKNARAKSKHFGAVNFKNKIIKNIIEL
jgi:glycosyltransferase involved in cell wall biosynthesis